MADTLLIIIQMMIRGAAQYRCAVANGNNMLRGGEMAINEFYQFNLNFLIIDSGQLQKMFFSSLLLKNQHARVGDYWWTGWDRKRKWIIITVDI